MFRSFRIGRLFGFPIDINFSFLILLAVIGLWAGGLAAIFAMIVAFGSVLLHELGHALVARRTGLWHRALLLWRRRQDDRPAQARR
mgnify:CR=1 FL=1